MENSVFKYPVLPALDGYQYLDEMKLFYAYFGTIPSVKRVSNVDLEELALWIEKDFGYVKKHFSSVRSRSFADSVYFCEIKYYVLKNDLLIKLDEGSLTVLFDASDEGHADNFLEKANAFSVPSDGNEIYLVIATNTGLDTERLAFRVPEVSLDKHYNDDLRPVHDKILDIVTESKTSGLILFHGAPGTGKSTYIKFLICGLNKKVIFITPELAGSLGNPEISKFLIQNAGSVFVIEDAEQLIVSRDAGRKSSISTILNLTDGILGESLGIQIIATFNTDIYNIDKALLRKGRMLALYEFKPLEENKSARLLEDQGFENVEVTSPMTLADIYNYSEHDFQLRAGRNAIGFNRI